MHAAPPAGTRKFERVAVLQPGQVILPSAWSTNEYTWATVVAPPYWEDVTNQWRVLCEYPDGSDVVVNFGRVDQVMAILYVRNPMNERIPGASASVGAA